ncbi:DNA polymerase III subunit alpha [Trichococcus sp.]|uniref:DNA polymerase III subunit alpha n=1 Tax=Trichococcus sp. TaxID=1985464 RepID=UPI003C7D3BFF
MSFVHLQVISAYSLLQTTTRIEDLVRSAKTKGYQAIALTDQNVLYGQVDFFKICKKYAIQPILGIQLDLPGIISKDRTFPLVLLAKDFEGYKKLMALSTVRNQDVPDKELLSLLEDDSSRIIAITPGEKGEIESFLNGNDQENAKAASLAWKKIFTHGNFYLGVQLHEKMKPIIPRLMLLSQETNIPTTAMHDVRYLEPSDNFSCRVLKAIEANEKVDLQSEALDGTYYLPSCGEVERKFREADLVESAETTQKIADEIEIDLPLHQSLLPRYPLPAGTTPQAYLRRLCEEGLRQRVTAPEAEYEKRLAYELEVIHEMGFDDYFLIVWDVMAYARKAKIMPGAGRGSAAGSLVSYVLRITHVDPIRYNLLFERFLNKERYNLPDIDLDFPDNRRDDILHYVRNKYGSDHVAQIATFGTLAAKMSLRDTARVFGLTVAEAQAWSNAIPNQLGISLAEAKQKSKELQKLISTNDVNRLLYETAEKIEGVPRHVSTHAAGVVISDNPLRDIVPLQKKNSDLYLTQYTMGNIEEIGLLKMDFLGLKNLTILNDAVQLASDDHKESINIWEIPMDDDRTLDIFRRADTNGVFQFESPGIKNVLRKLGPESIEDIAAVNALYRPGPMEQIDLFISRKKGLAEIDYLHPDLKSILEVTYGVMVYQEQVMQVASRMAGFSLGEADILRRAIGKKQKSAIDEERKHFIEGSLQQGYSDQTAEQVYDYIERFANYGFNRSHSVAYSFIAYQLAYMKAHFPEAFFAALLNSVNQHSDKMREYFIELKRRNISISYPDINTSNWKFALRQQTIQFGLGGIKGLRRDFIQEIIKERQGHGHYKDFVQFLRRIHPKWLKNENIAPLIYSGAFDSFGHSRATLLESLPGMLNSIDYSGNNVDLFSILEPKYVETEELPLLELLDLEEAALGHSLKGHPIDQFGKLYNNGAVVYVSELAYDKKMRTMGLIKDIRRIQTKKGDPMAFANMTDSTGEISVTIFPEYYIRFMKLLKANQLLVVEGKLERSKQADKTNFLVTHIWDAEVYQEMMGQKKENIFIRLTAKNNTPELFAKMYRILNKQAGDHPVILYNEATKQTMRLTAENWVAISPELLEALQTIFGNGNVAVK